LRESVAELTVGDGYDRVMDLELSGRRAVVTGASRGIGLAIARGLAAEGVVVGLVARDAETLGRLAAELSGVALPADTGDDESVAAMARTAIEQLGGVDIVVNAAATPNTAGGIPEESLEAEINVKVRGYLRVARAFAPGMAERGWGRIVNIGGLAARQAGTVAGSVRNAAVAAMTKNLADELGRDGINVSVVHPGMTETEKTPAMLSAAAQAQGITPEEARARIDSRVSIGRIVTAAEVADVVTFLCSPRSVAMSGDAVIASGGLRGPIHY
jgi:NAD(P)-dependent dehydrogenase (short-subunit alcohol dehydrogenase family)